MSNMTDNNPIEKWTRKQCEEYLKQYPKSLKSEAVRKRLEVLIPKPEPQKPSKAGNTNNVADVVGAVTQAKGNTGHTPERPTSKPNVKLQPKTEGPQSQGTGTTYVDEHEKGMAVVGKVVLTILVLALCFGIVSLCVALLGGESAIYTGPVCAGVAIPLANKIWKK